MSWAWTHDRWRAAGSPGVATAVGAGLSSLGMRLLVPVLPAYATSLGASGAEVGLLLASLGFARVVISLPAAWLAQCAGYRRLLITSPAVTVPAAVFCLLEGGAAGTYSLTGTATTMSTAARRRGRSLASLPGASLFGASIGPGIGGFVAQQFGIRALFFLYAALAAFVALWLTGRLAHAALPAPGAVPERRRENGPWLWRGIGAPALLPLWLLAFMLVFTRTGAQLVVAPLLGAQRLELRPQEIGVAPTLDGFAGLAVLRTDQGTEVQPASWDAAKGATTARARSPSRPQRPMGSRCWNPRRVRLRSPSAVSPACRKGSSDGRFSAWTPDRGSAAPAPTLAAPAATCGGAPRCRRAQRTVPGHHHHRSELVPRDQPAR